MVAQHLLRNIQFNLQVHKSRFCFPGSQEANLRLSGMPLKKLWLKIVLQLAGPFSVCICGWFRSSSEPLLLFCKEPNSLQPSNDSSEWLHDYTSFCEMFVFFPFSAFLSASLLFDYFVLLAFILIIFSLSLLLFPLCPLSALQLFFSLMDKSRVHYPQTSSSIDLSIYLSIYFSTQTCYTQMLKKNSIICCLFKHQIRPMFACVMKSIC